MSVFWNITKDTVTNIVRYEVVGVVPINLNVVQIGDYVNVFGTGFNVNNRGSFEIENVEVYYVGPDLYQAFEVTNPLGFVEVATQDFLEDVVFFRPTVNTIQNSNSRTVVVSSTVDGILDISIPATTQAVNREEFTGSYLHTNSSVAVTRINRDKNGEVTVFYTGSPSPAFAVNDTVFIDDLNTTPPETFKSVGVPGAFPASGTTDASTIDLVNVLQLNTTQETGRVNFDMITALNGDGLIIGGSTLVAGVPTSSTRLSRYHPVSSATVSDATLADGSTRYTYQWLNPSGSTTNGTELNRVANITTGPAINQVMINGGATLTLGNYSSTAVTFGSSRKYNPSTNTTTASGSDPQAFCGHTLTTLRDGRILSYGGGATINNLLCGTNVATGYLWNPGTQTWPSVGVNDIATTYKRAHHQTVELSDGKVLFIGGLAGAQEARVNSSTLAYWKFSELVGATIADSSGNAYNLTTSGVTAAVPAAKIDSGREFTQAAAHAAGAGNAGAVTALLGEWTVEWWSCGASGAYPAGMTLSGLGSGTIIAYGTLASELQADNTLMHVGITGGNLFFRWEHDLGVDVTGSVAITGHIVDHYNHFAVRKKFNGVNYDVDLFVNGHKIGSTFSGLANANGGANSQWYMARDPDGATGFSGVIDDVIISKAARSDEDILLDYWEGSPSISTKAGSRQHRIGRCLEYCEKWNPSGPSMSVIAPMGAGRAYHTATLLPDGKVIVIGGLSHDPTNFAKALYDAGPTTLNGCSVSSNSSEIYDTVANQWTRGPQFSIRRHNHSAIYVPSRNAIYVIGGESTQGDDVKLIEVLDLTTMRVTAFQEKLTYQSGKAILLNNGNILVATNEPDGLGGIRQTHELIILETPGLSNRGISDIHKITAIGSGYLKYQTPTTKYYFSNYGPPNKADVTSYTVTNGERTSNVTTLTFAGNHPFALNDYVYVNLNNTGLFGSGLKVVTSLTSNTISYAETAADQASVFISGSVFKNYSTDANVTAFKSVADSVAGPYILDPTEGISISNITDSVGGSLYTGIFKDQMYTILPVVDATVFPDEEGFIVIGFGTNLQTQPIKYFGHYNPEGLLIDYRYKFENNIPSGTEVVLLTQREPYAPTEPIGQFYATASAAGRVAAENNIKDITAAGIDVDVTIVYPGDRGLGAEGYPTKGAVKLSDKVFVWGGDDLDDEIEELRTDQDAS